jgi:glycerol-3-phosphate dehydrogenase
VKPPDDEGDNTKGLSREHTILVSRSGLVTVTGGKWTTYRAMAEDVLAQCTRHQFIRASLSGQTTSLALIGADAVYSELKALSEPEGLHSYGSEQASVRALPGAGNWLCEGLSEAMVRFASRHEYAITVEDVLARRSRLLFLDASLARQMAATVAEILEGETGQDPAQAEFVDLCQHYLLGEQEKP